MPFVEYLTLQTTLCQRTRHHMLPQFWTLLCVPFFNASRFTTAVLRKPIDLEFLRFLRYLCVWFVRCSSVCRSGDSRH